MTAIALPRGRAWPGLVASLLVAAAATAAGQAVPLVGAPVLAIVLGCLLAPLLPNREALEPGTRVAGKQVLQLSIVLLGTGLSLGHVVTVAASSAPVLVGTLVVALGGAVLLGRLLRVRGHVRTLIGVGTGVCGASAIAAGTAVLGAAEAEVAYAIGTIFVFNVAAVLLFPLVGHLLGLSQHAFGLWSGTAVNDTSSVVATGYAYGTAAGAQALVVKLARSLSIIPICVGLAVWRARRERRPGGKMAVPWGSVVPGFVVGFVLASAANSVGLIPATAHGALAVLGVFCITTALAGIGLATRPAVLRQAGHRPLLLGGLLWILVAVSSLALQAMTTGW